MRWERKQKNKNVLGGETEKKIKNTEGCQLLCGCLGRKNEMKDGEEEIGGSVGRVGVVLVLLLE